MVKRMCEILLNAVEIEKATGGTWVGGISELKINSVTNGILNRYGLGDLFFVRNSEHWGEGVPDTFARIPQVINKGVAAIVIEEQDSDRIDEFKRLIPFLVVKNTRIALFELAKASSKKARSIKKVQITGTEGKTSFKYFLSMILDKQKTVFFQESSANMQVPILLSLANIKANTDISVIEISCPAKGLGENRSQLITPDVAVITNVNPSHLNSHGGLQELISDKAESVLGVKKGGVCVVNSETDNFDLLIKKIKEFRSDIQIRTYGNTNASDSYVMQANFTDLGWDVTASIFGRRVSYRVNHVQEHAPSASVGILMVADILGLDVVQAAKELEFVNSTYKSSGLIKEMPIGDGGSFIFYDQHFSMTEVALRSAINDIKNISVTGKKIAVISGEYNSDKFTEEMHLRMGEYINNSDIDYLYTVGEHVDISTAVLEKKEIHRGHFDDIESCSNHVIGVISSGDLLFIKGMTKLNFEYLSNAVNEQFK
mgnify:CR=1 FL=1